MSLNGLDDPKIAEAHEAAVAEPGGWFLLKYTSRDEVELLGRGNGGIVELRTSVAAYEESSPLYGFLRYRRRNVIVKYLPEGCSRLVQARVAVHFNAICERFAPHDTIFEISTSPELKDSKLSAACSLHANSGSNSSSSSSLRRRRLNEIAEEEEDEQRAAKRKSRSDEPEPDRPETSGQPADPVTLNSELATSPEQAKFSAPTTSEVPTFVGADERPASRGTSIDAGRRMSSQSSRQEAFGYSAYAYSKPKVKLGPRPSLEVSNRPQTAGNFRPVSSIPAGFKLFGKGAKKGRGKEDSSNPPQPDDIPEIPFATTAIPIPEEPAKSFFEVTRPATSSGVSTKSATTMGGKSAMTPEKARLKKAMQLREKKKKKQSEQPPVPPLPVSEGPVATDKPAGQTKEGQAEKTQDAETPQEPPRKRMTIIKADSAIAMDASAGPATADQASDATPSDSRPASPIIASSEAEHSTKASSVSETAEEQVPTEDKVRPEASEEDDRENNTTPTQEDTARETSTGIKPEAETEGGQLLPHDESQPDANASLASDRHEGSTVDRAALVADVAEASGSETAEMQVEGIRGSVPIDTDAAEADADKPIDNVDGVDVAETVVTDHTMEDTTATQTTAEEEPVEKSPTEVTVDGETPNEVTADDDKEEAVPPAVAAPVSKFSAHVQGSKSISSDSGIFKGEPGQEDSKGLTLRTRARSASKHDLRAAAKAAANPSAVEEAVPPMPGISDSNDALIEDNADDSDAQTVFAGGVKPRPKTLIEPIRTDLASSRPQSFAETTFSDDDSLLEELHSATVQEAKPMFVAKTPVNGAFPGSPFSATSPPSTPRAQMVRTVSNPVRASIVGVSNPGSSSMGRHVSSGAAYLHKVTTQQTQAARNGDANLAAKKTGMGSRISQRIKALEMLSAGPSPEEPSSGRDSRPSSTFFSVRKGSREPSRSPSVIERANSFAKNAPSTSHSQSQSQSQPSRESSPETERVARKGSRKTPERKRSGSVASRLSMFEAQPGGAAINGALGHSPRGRPESISVTARIVRDPDHNAYNKLEAPKDPSQYNYLELKQSPILVDHQKATSPPLSYSPGQEAPPLERRASKDSRRSESQDASGKRSRRSSLTIVRDFIKDQRRSLTSSTSGDTITNIGSTSSGRSPTRPPSTHQNNSIAQRLSFSGSRRSLSRDRDSVLKSPASPWTDGAVSGDESRSASGEKKRSRTGRLMRRLSTLGSRSKNSISSSTSITDDTIHEPALSRPSTTATGGAAWGSSASAVASGPAIVAYMGDVNVQFPDTLLWKRRNLYLDAAGFLVLSALPAQSGRAATQATKRYHLSEFKYPYTPDVEIQELPNSVVLDLVDGGGVQVACEDRAGQMNVLNILQEAHAGHASSFGL